MPSSCSASRSGRPFGLSDSRDTFCVVSELLRRRAMSERISELLHRNLQEVFGEGDPVRRRAAIQELYTDDCVLYVPPGVFVGHDALDKFAGDLRATHPHFAYVPHGAPQALHNAGRLAWGSAPPGGKPDYTGLDVIIVRDDKIARQTAHTPGGSQGRYSCGNH